MARAIEIRRLTDKDRFVMFSTGDGAAARHFRHYAASLQSEHNLVATFVALEQHVFVGYAAIAYAYVEKRDPKPSSTPVLRVSRMVASDPWAYDDLLRFVMRATTRQPESCRGLLVDVSASRVERYKQLGFLELDSVVEGRLHGRAVPMFLDRATLETVY